MLAQVLITAFALAAQLSSASPISNKKQDKRFFLDETLTHLGNTIDSVTNLVTPVVVDTLADVGVNVLGPGSPTQPELASALVFVSVTTGLGVNLKLCVDANLDVNGNLQQTTSQIINANAVLAAAVTLGGLAKAETFVCATVLQNAVPTCDANAGCGARVCPVNTRPQGNACVPVLGPSQINTVRRRSLPLSKRALCPINETACSLSGSAHLTSLQIAEHRYRCEDLSSSVEACGSCNNACTGANQGCEAGICVNLDAKLSLQ